MGLSFHEMQAAAQEMSLRAVLDEDLSNYTLCDDGRYEVYTEYTDDAVSEVDKHKNITVNEEQCNLTQEENSQYVPFKLPRYWDGVDLMTKLIQFHYVNINGGSGISTAVNVRFNDSYIICGWLINKSVTAVAGDVTFEITATGTNEKSADYRWRTRPNGKFTVLEALSYDGIIEPSDDWYAGFVKSMQEYTTKAAESARSAQDYADQSKSNLDQVTQITETFTTNAQEVKETAINEINNAKVSGVNAVEAAATEIVNDREKITENANNISSLKSDLGDLLTEFIVTKQANDFTLQISNGDVLYYGIDLPNYNGTYSVFGYRQDNSIVTIQNNCTIGIIYSTRISDDIVKVRIYFNSAITSQMVARKILVSNLGFDVSSIALEALTKVREIGSIDDTLKKIGKNETVVFANTGKSIQYSISIDAGDSFYFKLDSYGGANLLSVTVSAIYDDDSNEIVAEGVSIGYLGKIIPNKHIKKVQFYYNLSVDETCDKTVIVNTETNTISNSLFDLQEKTKSIQNSFNVLVLGDSYSQTGAWIRSFKRLVTCKSLLNLGVSSATMRDRYTDRVSYPYTNDPISSDSSGNKNTFMCQVMKLKKMVSNGSYSVIPDIVFIQGGTNDTAETKEEDLETFLYEKKLSYVTRGIVRQENMYVKKPIETLDRTKFVGAMASIYTEIHNLYPNALIMFITPSGLSYPGGNNIDAKLKTEQIKDVATYIGCPVCEWGDVGFGYYGNIYTGDGTQNNPYTLTDDRMAEDWLHPNSKFGEILAKKVVCILNNYIPVL